MPNNNKQPSKGYLSVASKNQNFYTYAINLIESVKDYYPDARYCLVTDEAFLDGRESIVDDLILTSGEAIGAYRAKLWGMARSPYDQTMYLDADMTCEHEDIEFVFDDLRDRDMVFHELSKERENYFAVKYFNYNGKKEHMKLCGGVCLYNSAKPIVKEFMEDWWQYYNKQYAGNWMPESFDKAEFNKNLRVFDQTTLWWLTEKLEKYKDLNIGYFDDDIRWNYFSQYAYDMLQSKSGKPPVMRHFSGSLKKDQLIV
jgi:hypothetical protein